MSKPDNHIDELREVIKFDEFLDDYVDELNNEKTHGDLTELHKIQDEWLAQLDQYYADFYRNKIPEKREGAVKQGEIIPLDGKKKVEMHWLRKCQDAGFNEAVDLITAQFNSKGDK